MILVYFFVCFFHCSFPRIRGGDPVDLNVTEIDYPLFPAHAGVILWLVSSGGQRQAFPRTRGGDPAYKILEETLNLFSPHTRG